MCKQEQGETIRSYIKRFFDTRATIANVADNDVIDYFHDGITVQSLYRDFGCNRPKTVVVLRDMMQCWGDEEEEECGHFPRHNNTTMGSVTMIVAAAAASGTLCANESQTMSSGLSNVARVARSQASHRISSIKSCITKGA